MSLLFDSNQELRLAELQEQLRRTPDRMADVIARACLRVQAHHPGAKARLIRLVESGAFTDASLALLELELPQWKLRRLVYDDGEWHCALSKRLALPTELDETADANHEVLPLAILSAFVEARRRGMIADEGRPRSVPHVQPVQGHVVCCDNFA